MFASSAAAGGRRQFVAVLVLTAMITSLFVLGAPAANAGSTVDSVVTVTGISISHANRSVTVNYKINKTIPVTHRTQLKLYNVNSTTKFINQTVTLPNTVGTYTKTFSSLSAIADVVNIRTEYQTYVTTGVYSTTDSTNTYRLYGPTTTSTTYKTVSSTDAALGYVAANSPGIAFTMFLSGVGLSIRTGLLINGLQVAADTAKEANSTYCNPSVYTIKAGSYYRSKSTWSASGSNLVNTQQITVWKTKAEHDAGQAAICNFTQTWTVP